MKENDMPITVFPSEIRTSSDTIITEINNISNDVDESTNTILNALGSLVKVVYHGSLTLNTLTTTDVNIGGTVNTDKSIILINNRATTSSVTYQNSFWVTASFKTTPTATQITIEHMAGYETKVNWQVLEFS
jgi:hypothetical protein